VRRQSSIGDHRNVKINSSIDVPSPQNGLHISTKTFNGCGARVIGVFFFLHNDSDDDDDVVVVVVWCSGCLRCGSMRDGDDLENRFFREGSTTRSPASYPLKDNNSCLLVQMQVVE
jgi:hypothetical protein